jgi:hypothetical protein
MNTAARQVAIQNQMPVRLFACKHLQELTQSVRTFVIHLPTFSKVARWARFRVLLAPQTIALAVFVLLDHTAQTEAWLLPNYATQGLSLTRKLL